MTGDRSFLVIARARLPIYAQHIDALRSLDAAVHVLCEDPVAREDPRFASVTLLPASASLDEATEVAIGLARRHAVAAAVSFGEIEGILTARVNRALGRHWAHLDAHELARDKSRQRRFLVERGIPAPDHRPVTTPAQAIAATRALGFPVVVKPTRASASMHVVLANSEPELLAALEAIAGLAATTTNHYYEHEPGPLAMIEEFLSGDEVTVDALVVDGRAILAGVHAKEWMPGPYFLEDFYVLPTAPESDEHLVEIVQAIVDGLGLTLALVNVELRQDTAGDWRVIEFATRITGGHAYRNIREVHDFDLVRLFGAACLGDHGDAVSAKRQPARMTTCVKRVSREGTVVRNAVGEAVHSAGFLDYTAVASPGAHVRLPPSGYNLTGLLSVFVAAGEPDPVARVRSLAIELESRLDVVVR